MGGRLKEFLSPNKMTRVFSSILIICQMTPLSGYAHEMTYIDTFLYTAEKAITQQSTAPCNLVKKHDRAESFSLINIRVCHIFIK